jgi:hypothetical protein
MASRFAKAPQEREKALPCTDNTGFSIRLSTADRWKAYFTMVERYANGEVKFLRRRFVQIARDMWEVHVYVDERGWTREMETFVIPRSGDITYKLSFKQLHNQMMRTTTTLTHFI